MAKTYGKSTFRLFKSSVYLPYLGSVYRRRKEEKMCKYQNSANKLPTFHSGNGACSLKALLPGGHGPSRQCDCDVNLLVMLFCENFFFHFNNTCPKQLNQQLEVVPTYFRLCTLFCKTYPNSANKLPIFHSGNSACSLKALLLGNNKLLGSV